MSKTPASDSVTLGTDPRGVAVTGTTGSIAHARRHERLDLVPGTIKAPALITEHTESSKLVLYIGDDMTPDDISYAPPKCIVVCSTTSDTTAALVTSYVKKTSGLPTTAGRVIYRKEKKT